MAEIDKVAEIAYNRIRKQGMSDVPIIARNSGLSEMEVEAMKKHLFFGKHKLPINEKECVRMRFAADSEVAHAWEKATQGELSEAQKEWFRQLADHELAERAAMGRGLPYRDPAAYDSASGVFNVGNSAHDNAPLAPKFEFPK